MRRLPPLPTICMVSALGAEVPGSAVSTMADIFLGLPSAPAGGTGTSETALRDLKPAAPVGGAQLGRTWGRGVLRPHSCATGASAPRGTNSTPTPLFLAPPTLPLSPPERAVTGCLRRAGLAFLPLTRTFHRSFSKTWLLKSQRHTALPNQVSVVKTIKFVLIYLKTQKLSTKLRIFFFPFIF